MIDVTNEYDVSDEVTEHDANILQEEVGINNDENMIHIRSMDGNTYLMDADAIDWNETLKNINVMRSNLEFLHSTLMNLMFSETQSADVVTQDSLEMLKAFVTDFGLLPKYEEVYTDASNTLLAKLYCIDAIELIHTVLREVEVYNANKVAMQMLYNNQNSNDQQEEEAHENPVQEV